MITLKEYKQHLINQYHYEIDNTPTKREERKLLLESKYSDEDLNSIINNTYLFIKDVLDNAYIEEGFDYYKIPLEKDTTSYISLNQVGGYHSDTLFQDDKGRTISKYIIKQFLGEYFYIDLIEEEREVETDDDVLSFDHDYYIYMQNFPKKLHRYKREINLITQKPINVIFLDFDGTLVGLSDPKSYEGKEKESLEKVDKRIAILADICQAYNCKVVISSGSKIAIDEQTMEVDSNSTWVKTVLELFKKHGIECIGRTPDVRKRLSKNSEISQWKEDEIRLYLLRHPEIVHYCVLDDEDTINLFHWKKSDLEKVREHLVSPIYYDKEHPENEGLQPYHKEEVGKALEKENEIRRLVLKRKNRLDK